MKKLFLFLLIALAVAGCASTAQNSKMSQEEIDKIVKEYFAPVQEEQPNVQPPEPEKVQPQATEKTNTQVCKISKYDCWEVAQLFKLGTESKKEERNTKLQKMGLTVTFSTMYRDGGSWGYQLSDGTYLHVSNSIWDNSGDIKIKLPGGQTFLYDDQGNRKNNL